MSNVIEEINLKVFISNYCFFLFRKDVMLIKSSVLVLLVVTCVCLVEESKAFGNFPQTKAWQPASYNYNGRYAATNIVNNFKNIPVVPANNMSPGMNGMITSNTNGAGSDSQSIFNRPANTLSGSAAQSRIQSSQFGSGAQSQIQSSQFGNPNPTFVVQGLRPKVFFTQSGSRGNIGNSELGGSEGGGFEPNIGFFPEEEISSQVTGSIMGGMDTAGKIY